MTLQAIRQVFDQWFFWLPKGNDLTKRSYQLSVWGILCLLVLYNALKMETTTDSIALDTLSPQFTLTSRYVLGVKNLMDRGDVSPVSISGSEGMESGIYADLIDELLASQTTDTDKLAFSILLSEFFGNERAIDYLKNLQQSSFKNPDKKDDAILLLETFQSLSGDSSEAIPHDYLIERFDWLGELLLSNGTGEFAERRKEIVQATKKTATTIYMLILLIGVLILGRLVLDIVGVIRKRKLGVSLTLFQSGPAPIRERIVLLEAVVVFLGLLTLSSLIAMYLSSTLGMVMYFISILAVLWPLLRGVEIEDLKSITGMYKGEGILKEAGEGLKIYIRCVPILLAGIYFTYKLIDQSGEAPVHPIIYQMDSENILETIKWLFIASVFAPLAEELIFRGAFYHYFRQRYSFLISSFVTSFLFAAIHPQGLTAIPAIMAIGISFSIMRELRYSIIASTTAHMVHNSLITLFLLAAM